MKRKSLVALLLAFTLLLTACGNGGAKNNKPANNAEKNNKNSSQEEAPKSDLKVGFVTDEGGINDESFNQGVWEGLQRAANDFGLDASYQQSKDENDYRPGFGTLLDDEKDLIIGAGFKMGGTIIKEAQANPDVKFAIVDVDPTNEGKDEAPANLLGIMFKAQEPSFMVGYIAGQMTKTDKVGFVGGQEGTIIWGFEYGYKAGVEYAAKELGKKIEILSQYVGDFSDAQKGKVIANTMYQNGADIVFQAAGGAGLGVIESARGQGEGKWVIGVDKDQYDLAPDNVLTSAMKNANVAIYEILKDLSEGKEFQGGTTRVFGLQDAEAVGISPSTDKHVPQEIIDKTNALVEKIVSEEIKVPYNAETYEEYGYGK